MNLLLVGCGKMGGALLRGAAAKAERIVVVEPSPNAEMPLSPNVTRVMALAEIAPDFKPDVVVFAIKPQVMAEVVPSYARYRASVFLSIAAGKTLAHLEAWLGNRTAIVRAMPNLPASIGKGISGAVSNSSATEAQRSLCETILRATGEMVWLDDESLLDAVTALSGSGPAYFFALVEAMADAGETLGLPRGISEKLARQTLIGSGALVEQSKESVANLRKAVTSPKGTTEAALNVLQSTEGLAPLLFRAMKAAASRSEELAR